MAMIPSERFVFADLTVDDNLLLGAANDATRTGGCAGWSWSAICSRSWSSAPVS